MMKESHVASLATSLGCDPRSGLAALGAWVFILFHYQEQNTAVDT